MLIHADGTVEARFTGGQGSYSTMRHAGLRACMHWLPSLRMRQPAIPACGPGCPHARRGGKCAGSGCKGSSSLHPPCAADRAVALPARGRTVLGQWASAILLQNLPR